MSDDQFLSPDQRFQMDYMEMQTMREPPCPTCGQELPTTDYYLRQTEQPPTTAGTWVPDWSDLTFALMGALDQARAEDGKVIDVARAVIAEYQNQLERAGLVLVSATDLRVLLDHFTGFGDAYAEACKARLDAAMPEHPEGTRPGGDES